MKREKIGFRVRIISNLLRRYIDHMIAVKHDGKFTRMQGWIVAFIAEQHDKKDIFQKDIEEEFIIRRSTATAILQRMEKSGLITRNSVDYDGRLKKIQLTPAAMEEHVKIEKDIEEFEENLANQIDKDDLAAFFRVLDQIEEKLSDHF